MGNVLHKTMEYLGLRDEDASDHHYGQPAHGARSSTEHGHPEDIYDDAEYEYTEEHDADVMHLPHRNGAFDVAHEPKLTLMSRIITVHPRSPYEAPTLGNYFRQGIPVILNITSLKEDEARRLVDFAAGLTYGLEGRMARIAKNVFLLSPAHVSVTNDTEEVSDSSSTLISQP